MDKTKIAVNIFDKCADLYQSKFMDVSLYGDTFDFFCNHIIKQNAEVLELACGPGNITRYLLNKRPDLKISGTDLAPRMLDLAKKNNPEAEFYLLDCKNILTLDKKFDALMCGFCLPYLSKEEVEKLIKDASKVVNAGGIIYISTIEDDHEKSAFKKGSTGDEIFMHYYRSEFLEDTLKGNNFNVFKVDRKKSPAMDGTITTDLIIISELKK